MSKETLSLVNAQKVILECVKQLPSETVGLKDVLGRITFSSVSAAVDLPFFDESMRDGYAVASFVELVDGVGEYQVVDEIPAGKLSVAALRPGAACKIMTGGCVPHGADRVVPYEKCDEQDDVVVIAGKYLQSKKLFIRRTGSEVRCGDTIISRGVSLQAEHLPLLVSSGVSSVEVSSRPSVGCLCTGSELKSSLAGLEKGQKASSNSFLLQGMLTGFGACPDDLGIVHDDMSDIVDSLARAKGKKLDVIITTGGMGPGKYDLVEKAFLEIGGHVVFRALEMRPGKSLLFGTLGSVLFFGLPGPPPAVQTLLYELVGPALMALQGGGKQYPQQMRVHLQHTIQLKRNNVLRLKDGVMSVEEGRCLVRLSGKHEIPNCYILFQAGKEYYSGGDLVDVHLLNVGG